eukprot:CCRYP_013036-RB/>CCRYP_013036-RB protein AED:0.05 eAED:0.05 QI:326/1/1/1/0.66/0.5/4/2043/389
MNIFQRHTIPALTAFLLTAFTLAFQPSPHHHHTPRHTTHLFSESGGSVSTPTRIAVAGATGRTGRYVVSSLLSRSIPVLALVRDTEKATNLFDPTDELLSIRKTDLGSEEDVLKALSEEECEAAIWCATGFSDAPDQSIWTKLQAVLGLAVKPRETIDAVGLPALGKGLAKKGKRIVDGKALPRVVMLSSAGVTRPGWSEEKKEALEGCAGIPIVRLNPFGILGVKEESENVLRKCGVDYSIFRPCGLNDNWPSNQRPIFSQGDVAVGRINRKDVAQILVDILSTPEATGKTFEAITIANSDGYYPPATTLSAALGRLQSDSENGGKGPSEEVVRATYAIMQQLLPGEKQDASKLAMGQTYEQLDKGETGRLGVKGQENVAGAGLTPSS